MVNLGYVNLEAIKGIILNVHQNTLENSGLYFFSVRPSFRKV